MKLDILKQTKRPLTERMEILAKFSDFEKTPSYVEIKEEISKKIGKDLVLIVPKKVNQEFGMHEATVEIYIYDSETSLKKFEPKTKEKKAGTA
jgi:ribosomal protein S24E